MTVENLEIKVKTDADQAAAKLTSLSNALSRVQSSAKGVSGNTGNTAKGISKVGDAAKKANKPLGNFISSLKRIAFYRIIRGIIKSITSAFSEGLEKAYLFSSGIVGEGNRFAQAMDSIKSKGNEMKGQLGSAFISLLTAIEPILIQLINLVTKVADALSQLFAAFTGRTYIKANQTAAKFADTMAAGGKAAKEWKNQLLGFDEINRLNEPSSGGGGGGTNPLAGYSFEDTPLADWAMKLHELFSNLNINFKDVFFKWENLTAEDIAKKLVVGLSALAGGVIGFMLGGVGGAVIGVVVGASIGLLLDSMIFNNDGVLGRDEVGALVQAGLLGLLGGAIGLVVGGPGGALLGAIIGLGVSAVIESVKFFNNDPEKAKYATSLDWFVVGVLGLPSDEQWTQWGKNAIKWIGEGFKDLGHTLWLIIGQPIVDVVEEIKQFLGISSNGAPAAGFEDIGTGIVNGLKNGVESAWKFFTSMFEGLWNDLKTWWDGLTLNPFHIPSPHFSWTYSQAEGVIAQALQFVGLPATIPHLNISWYAQGGFPETGQLFFANENGSAEMVGSMGGHTAVANNDQIVEGIRQGVYDAVMAANNNGGSDVSVKVYLDSREIQAGQQRLARAWG